MGKKCEKINGDLTIILVYMNGDLRYTCGGKVDLCMDKPVFKRKIYDEIYEWKENRSDKYALLIKGARRVGKSTIAEEFAKKSLNRIFSLTLLIQVRQLLIYLMICMIWIFLFAIAAVNGNQVIGERVSNYF